MNNACLHNGLFPDGTHRIGQAFEPVADQHAHIAHPGPQPQDVPLAVHGDAQGQVDGPVGDLALADLHVNGVDEQDSVNGSRGRLCHSAMPSITRSVIVVIVCLETSAPYTSARCAAISPWVSPFADREITISSTPVSRRCLFATIFGSKLESRSRGTAVSTGPESVS